MSVAFFATIPVLFTLQIQQSAEQIFSPSGFNRHSEIFNKAFPALVFPLCLT